ncbi:sterol desaturase family protein [Ferrovum sp. PN-J185]|uniref:sterol desaturase family protein n=1 Tax=Ferrovum sp. PN-J185 TaxID=1356306 RepID=UPI000795C35D|nr:sterol desaturase family protein [Ferrovum sp. PN-J185]KXW56197.1 fatty acid hydroxylase superfamily protein [Ferrovum sp. PN-J185]MCC6067741.1 sterol desaturase family protein [Ferrovum sp. PN-J185]MDE1892241.1 sterol desaturase family protein [Betaproteobacteria bacterium]MDE2056839.1 sterol desaturase family protein [Betaproteobacteria bacterium]
MTDLLTPLQAFLFEHWVEPLFQYMGLQAYVESAYDAIYLLLLGVIEILILVVVFRPLEALKPVENWPDRRSVAIDILYTLLHRLGFIPLALFFILWPITYSLDRNLRLHGFIPLSLEEWFPILYSNMWLSFVVYLLIIDFMGYWIHRLQHRLEWWWALHGLHHSQRQMSYWTDDRNHLLDDILTAAIFSLLALLIGVAPNQLVIPLMLTRILQSFAHSNVAIDFGYIGERLLVSPRFHRIHHSIGIGSESGNQSCNFAVLFPIWDILFGTARFNEPLHGTGIEDQLTGRSYGEGFWAQQWLGLQRLARTMKGLKA